MRIITLSKPFNIKTININFNTSLQEYQKQLLILKNTDNILLEINKEKYKITKNIVKYIETTKIPTFLNINDISLMALLDYFQKKFVKKSFIINLDKYFISNKLEFNTINIISKINNFPHLLGVNGIRDNNGEVLSKIKPKEFLDGILYQWILINAHNNYKIDYEKLEVLSWLGQTLSNPTYILSNEAINKNNTRFNADLIFIRKVTHSDKYAFHIIGLKQEKNENYTFVSQFPISKKRYHRLKIMFDLSNCLYSFYQK